MPQNVIQYFISFASSIPEPLNLAYLEQDLDFQNEFIMLQPLRTLYLRRTCIRKGMLVLDLGEG